MVAVMFVCLGNICRSPAAEAILKSLLTQDGMNHIEVASCGIGDWHIGQLPDKRMREAGQDRGLAMATRAQQFNENFLETYDYILAADHEILNDLHRYAQTPAHKNKLHLIMSYSECYDRNELPDPYYGSQADFDQVLDMLEDACKGLIRDIIKRYPR